MRIFSSGAITDVMEYSSSDSTLFFSDSKRLQVIEDNAHQAAELKRQKEQAALKKEAEAHAKERGFPAGGYTVTALYIDYKGVAQTRTIIEEKYFQVGVKDTKEQVQRGVESWLSLYGLHNFGLDASYATYQDQGAPVHVVMRNAEGIEVSFNMRVDGSGHLVKKSKV